MKVAAFLALAFASNLLLAASASAQITGGPFNQGNLPSSPPTNPTRSDVTVSYDSLRAVDETISVTSIDNPTIVESQWGNSIRILVNGTSACGKEFFVDNRDPKGISFYQLGFASLGHVQPACLEKIEYLWQPFDWDLEEGKTSVVQLVIKRNQYVVKGQTPAKDIVVKAKIKRSSTPMSVRYLVQDLSVENQTL